MKTEISTVVAAGLGDRGDGLERNIRELLRMEGNGLNILMSADYTGICSVRTQTVHLGSVRYTASIPQYITNKNALPPKYC